MIVHNLDINIAATSEIEPLRDFNPIDSRHAIRHVSGRFLLEPLRK